MSPGINFLFFLILRNIIKGTIFLMFFLAELAWVCYAGMYFLTAPMTKTNLPIIHSCSSVENNCSRSDPDNMRKFSASNNLTATVKELLRE